MMDLEKVKTKSQRFKRFYKPSFLISLSAGVVTSFIICFELWQLYKPKTFDLKQPRYLVSQRDISLGASFNAHDFDLNAGGPTLSADAVSDQDLAVLSGAEFIRPVGEGQTLTWPYLKLAQVRPRLGKNVPRGFRAYSLNPSEFLPARSGDRVDVILSPASQLEMPLILVEGALTLEAGFRDKQFEIVLALTREDIEMVEKGGQRGKLKIALRNPDDELRKSSKRFPSQLHRRSKINQSVEILTEAP